MYFIGQHVLVDPGPISIGASAAAIPSFTSTFQPGNVVGDHHTRSIVQMVKQNPLKIIEIFLSRDFIF